MILIDTSAWIEFLRDTGTATCNRVEALLESEIAIRAAAPVLHDDADFGVLARHTDLQIAE